MLEENFTICKVLIQIISCKDLSLFYPRELYIGVLHFTEDNEPQRS